MKNTYKYIGLFTALVIALFINQSCSNPFEGITTILTNIKIDHSVNVQIIDANPDARNPYPSKAIVTLGGDAVDNGLIYSTDGKLLTTAEGSATVVRSTVTLAVRPFTIISESKPLRFYIKAEAANYISNTKEIVITSLDSLQTVKLPLLKIATLPEGIAIETTTETAVAGDLTRDVDVIVESKVEGTTTTETVVTATFPASTDYIDASNNIITTSGDFVVTVVSVSAETPEAIAALPGGLQAATITDEAPATIILAGAVEINASIGGTDIKSFSEPIAFEIKISDEVFNPVTQAVIKAGDELPVWSKEDNSVLWKREGSATIVDDPATGGLKVTMQVNHLSTWMVGFFVQDCANTTTLNYVSNFDEPIAATINVNVNGGNNQLIDTKTIPITNGDEIKLILPKDLNVTVTVYDASSTSAVSFSTIELTACATSGTISNTVVSTNPVLSFDLETRCKNGNFRYSGPIEFKSSTSNVWIPFTASDGGKLTTNLLEWDQIYDFRIIYRDNVYQRRRTILQSEFREVGNVWEYFGKTTVQQTFFASPTSCN